MTTSTATAYGNDIAAKIIADCEAGTPFGLNEDTGEELSALDWLDESLDFEYRVDSKGDYRSALVMIGCGGPNVYVDTKTSELKVYWYSSEVTIDLPVAFTDLLNVALEEMWRC